MLNSRQYQIKHDTRYEYTNEVIQARHLLHLRPRQSEFQTELRHSLRIDPAPTDQVLLRDAFGNEMLHIVIDRPHARLHAKQGISWGKLREQLSYTSTPRTRNDLDVLRYRQESPHVKLKNAFRDFAVPSFTDHDSLMVCAIRLMNNLFETLTYKPGATNTTTPLLEVLEKRHGVCQDYAHLMIACLRSMGLPARYVSGYLRTAPLNPLRDTNRNKPESKLIGADASHAWVSVYVPPFGWIDLDPTNNLVVNMDHITLGWGRDFSDVSPLRGVITGGGAHQLIVGVSVIPVAQ